MDPFDKIASLDNSIKIHTCQINYVKLDVTFQPCIFVQLYREGILCLSRYPECILCVLHVCDYILYVCCDCE